MKLVAFTIVLDGMPWIEKHLPVFQALSIPWQWIVVEGASGNTADTAWCTKQKPRLSEDGTTGYLRTIKDDSRYQGAHCINLIQKKSWPNKVTMCNAALEKITEDCVLLQVDSDELWRTEQLETIVRLFAENPQLSSIMFPCRYFVGEELVLECRGNCYGNHDYEWLRAWRFNPSQRFASHEPPILTGDDPKRRMGKDDARKLGLTFDHMAYATEAQCAYKENFYAYRGLVNQWRGLQRYNNFPAPLSRFFSHVTGDEPKVVRI
jgi:hypothetical protein